MNEILQKRIEEKSKELGQIFFPDNMNVFARPNWEAGYIETACKEIASFALQNQWISVDEALPPKQKTTKGEELEQSIPVFVRDNEGNYTSAWYSFYGKCWYMAFGEAFLKQSIYSKITHWMEIPSLKGGEE